MTYQELNYLHCYVSIVTSSKIANTNESIHQFNSDCNIQQQCTLRELNQKNHTKSDGLKSNQVGGNTVHMYLKLCCKWAIFFFLAYMIDN